MTACLTHKCFAAAYFRDGKQQRGPLGRRLPGSMLRRLKSNAGYLYGLAEAKIQTLYRAPAARLLIRSWSIAMCIRHVYIMLE